MPSSNPYQPTIYTGVSGTQFIYAFDVEWQGTRVVVRRLLEGETAYTTLVEDQVGDLGYTHTPNDKTITLNTAISTGDVLRIERDSSIVRQQDYQSGSTLTADQLDADALRLTQVDQEIEANTTSGMQKNATLTAWAAEGLKVENAGQAVEGTDLATLAQVNAIVLGGDGVAEIDGVDVFVWYGDAVTTLFEVPNYNTLDPARIIIDINGAVQEPDGTVYTTLNPGDAGHPGGSWAWVQFVNPPADHSVTPTKIVGRIVKGTVVSVLDTAIITSDALPDGVLEERHFNFPNTPKARMVFGDFGTLEWQVENSVDPFVGSLNSHLSTYPLSGMGDPDGPVDMGGHRVINAASGTQPSDLVTKSQLDSATSSAFRWERVQPNGENFLNYGDTYDHPNVPSTTNVVMYCYEYELDPGAENISESGVVMFRNASTTRRMVAREGYSISAGGSISRLVFTRRDSSNQLRLTNRVFNRNGGGVPIREIHIAYATV